MAKILGAMMNKMSGKEGVDSNMSKQGAGGK